MGAYYREWLVGERLLHPDGCQDAQRFRIRADKDQRTIETGRALAESILPGCGVKEEWQPGDQADDLFSGAGDPDPERSLKALRERLGPDPQKLLEEHNAALRTLQFILNGGGKTSGTPAAISLSLKAKSVEMEGPLATGSTLSEDLLLEYLDGMQGAGLGWGRLTRGNLYQVLELHEAYSELMRRTPYLARTRGSNLLAHVLGSLEQAAAGKPAAGALGKPGDALLVLSGHDTNLSNLSGMMGLSWSLPGYRKDDTPPGGALIFSLWRDGGTGGLSLRLRYVAQSLDQMRDEVRLSAVHPPLGQDVPLPGCAQARTAGGCPWTTARMLVRKAIDPAFTSMTPAP